MALGLQIPTLALIEVHDAGVCEQADALCSHLSQGVEDVRHHLLAKSIALIQGVHRDVPDGGFENTIPGAARKSNQTRNPSVVTPQPDFEQAVSQCFADPSNRTAAPAHSFQELLELHQIKGVLLAEDQGELVIGTRAETGPLAVLLQ